MMLVDELPLLCGITGGWHLGNISNVFDDSLFDGLPERIAVNHIVKVFIALIASARHTDDVAKTIIGIEQEFLPPLLRCGCLAHNMVRFIVKDGYLLTGTLQA